MQIELASSAPPSSCCLWMQVVLFGTEDGAVQAGVAEPATRDAYKQNPVVEELRGLDAMTPRDALNALYELKKKVGDGE